MSKSVLELQKNQFGFLHEYHTERTAGILEALQARLGDEVIQTIENADIDRYGLYRWHLERTVNMLNALENKFGPQVMDIVLEYEISKQKEKGFKLAKELGKNSLEDIIPYFTGGNNDSVVEENENEVLIKTTGCLSGKIVSELGKYDMLYNLHCGLDKYFIEGFNNELGCEIIKTIMEGSDCCLHRIYKKLRYHS
jgi:hypothetical protein